jgi:hypothetical protein
MSRLVLAGVLASLLAGCVTSEGPYSTLAVGTFEPRHAAQVAAERRQAEQVASRRVSQPKTPQAPVVRREAQASLILGAAF